MRTYQERIDLPATVARDENFLAECEAKLRELTTDWPDRRVSVRVDAGNTIGEGDSIGAALDAANSSITTFNELHLHVISPASTNTDRHVMLWIYGQHGDSGFVAKVSVESLDEVEAAGLPVTLSRLADSHAARIEEERKQEERKQEERKNKERMPPSEVSPSTAGSPWWKDHWVITIAGGAIAAILASLILQFIL